MSLYTIVLVDVELVELQRSCLTVSSQVAAADLVLVNKIDVVSEEDLKRIVPKVKEINPNACCNYFLLLMG